MPSHHGLRLDDNDCVKTPRPEAIQEDPKNSVQSCEPNSSTAAALENFQLMTQGDELELQNGTASEGAESTVEDTKQDLSRGSKLRDVTAKN